MEDSRKCIFMAGQSQADTVDLDAPVLSAGPKALPQDSHPMPSRR